MPSHVRLSVQARAKDTHSIGRERGFHESIPGFAAFRFSHDVQNLRRYSCALVRPRQPTDHALAADSFASVMDALIRVHRHARELNAVLGARMQKQIKLDTTDDFQAFCCRVQSYLISVYPQGPLKVSLAGPSL